MGHPSVENETPFSFEPLFLADEEMRPVLVPLVKATFDIGPRGLMPAEKQLPALLEGDPYGEPETSSYRFEPEGCLPKPATDVALVGNACAPRAGTTEIMVAFQVGPLRKGARVLGDRQFFKSVGSVGMTRPVPFEKIPLCWERAFGGWDRSNPDERKHDYERRNPVGVGFRAGGGRFEEGLACPNLEDAVRPLQSFGDRPPPAGFGFTSPHWEPRCRLAGTYDVAWSEKRSPLLPKDFDRRFLNSAAPGLTANGFLRGDETVVATGVSPQGALTFALPGLRPPAVRVTVSHGADATVPMNLDTVVVDAELMRVLLYWRGQVRVREPTSVRAIRISAALG